jgi:hypothetical protein
MDYINNSDGHMQEIEKQKEETKIIMLSLMCSLSSKLNTTMSNVLSLNLLEK